MQSPATEDRPRERRSECARCGRPVVTCFCAFVRPLETRRTRVVILQHRRESGVGIGTARMAHLCLPGSALFVGVDFDDDAEVRRALAPPAYVLYPSDDAIDLSEAPPGGPLTLVVVDGTWWQARSLVRRNALLSALPKVRFSPRAPSNYRIRREPAEHCVATIEALAHVLGELEGDPARFATMLAPFEHMVEQQLRYAREVRGVRERHALHRARCPRRPDLPTTLASRAPDLVCVHGEANAWPVGREGSHGSEIVHWLAERPATGEPWEAFVERWGRFVRGTDVLCGWGTFPMDLLARDGLVLPQERLDLRAATGRWLGRRGGLDRCLERLGLTAAPPWARGRGGRRLATLVTLVASRLG